MRDYLHDAIDRDAEQRRPGSKGRMPERPSVRLSTSSRTSPSRCEASRAAGSCFQQPCSRPAASGAHFVRSFAVCRRRDLNS